jgi:hypothetical protein
VGSHIQETSLVAVKYQGLMEGLDAKFYPQEGPPRNLYHFF